jgi:hypothetical protein
MAKEIDVYLKSVSVNCVLSRYVLSLHIHVISTLLNGAGWRGGNALDSHSVDASFESRLEQRVS